MSTLTDRVRLMKFKYKLKSEYGEEAQLLLVPRKPSELRRFCNALVDELGAEVVGPAHHVYHFLSTGERTMEVFDLKVVLYEGEELGVGNYEGGDEGGPISLLLN